jgi:hypothetical protein
VTPGGSHATVRGLPRLAAGTPPHVGNNGHRLTAAFRVPHRPAWVTVTVWRAAEDVRTALPQPVRDLGGLAEVRVRPAGAGRAELGLRLSPAYPRDLWDRLDRHRPERVLRAVLRQAKAELEAGGHRVE